jgi:predicted dehydrogenase
MISGYAYPVIDFPVLAITFPNGLRCLCMSQPLRGALIGCGFFGRIQLEAWHRMPDVEIVAACDPDLDRAKQAAPRAYAEPEAMLAAEQLDFVDIATRPDSHLPLVRLAVAHRIPAICQKPVAESLAQAIEMARVAGASGVRVMVHENWRWQPWYRELKRLLDAGTIGRPHYLALRHRMSDGVGEQPYPRQPYFSQMPRLLLIETMIHFLDTARFLVGELSVRHAVLRRLNPHVVGEDLLVLVLEGGEQLTAVIDGNRLSEPEQDGTVMGDARIEGSLGTLSLLGDGRIFVRPIGGSPVEHRYRIPTHGYRGDSAYATLSHFIDCLESGAPFETSGPDYLQTSRLVFDAYRMAGW